MLDGPNGFDLVEMPWDAPRYVSAEAKQAALETLRDPFYRPASLDEMKRELAALALRCKVTDEAEQFNMRCALYAQDLRCVPLRLLRQAASRHARESKWFPTVAELLAAARKIDPDAVMTAERLMAVADAEVDRFPPLDPKRLEMYRPS